VHAVLDAAAAEAQVLDAAAVAAALLGRTFLEASLALFPALAASDPTIPELIALRAQRGYRALVQHGVSFNADLVARVHTAAAAGQRVVVRADSERRDVEPLLMLAGVEHMMALLRCSDDAPRGPGATIQRSWDAIDGRLQAMQIGGPARAAWEAGPTAAAVAAAYTASVHVV
jgi:hypothetical protein